MNAVAIPASRPAPRGAIWFALVVAFALLFLPDCCLNGRHAFGAGMDAFGPVCRSAS
jgi:hypothetical protein